MAIYNKFNQFVADRSNKVHNLGADSLKFMLTNTAPVATNSVKADITEITAGSGYTAGGSVVAITSSTQTSGTYSLVPTADVVFTASGGSMAQFRYVVLYNSSTVGGSLISWYDRGSAVDLLDTETFTVDVGATLLTDV
tara:strand:- start:7348 stop:7764 length:417 start_codon:yes stop_codon:yes gene_type:complete